MDDLLVWLFGWLFGVLGGVCLCSGVARLARSRARASCFARVGPGVDQRLDAAADKALASVMRLPLECRIALAMSVLAALPRPPQDVDEAVRVLIVQAKRARDGYIARRQTKGT